MKTLFSRRTAILLWVAGLCWLIAIVLYPVSIGLTRVAGSVMAGLLLVGLLGLWWRYRFLRWGLLAAYGIVAGFFALPGREDYDRTALRQEVVRALERYEGVRYIGGGENFLGLDGSGLVRRGAIDGTLWFGLRTGNPLLARKAIRLWWRDVSAREMGDGARGSARKVAEAKSIALLNDANLYPGDFAVTFGGVHVLAYLGDHFWLEADPGESKAVRINARSTKNPWFQQQVAVMRWRFLEMPYRRGAPR